MQRQCPRPFVMSFIFLDSGSCATSFLPARGLTAGVLQHVLIYSFEGGFVATGFEAERDFCFFPYLLLPEPLLEEPVEPCVLGREFHFELSFFVGVGVTVLVDIHGISSS